MDRVLLQEATDFYVEKMTNVLNEPEPPSGLQLRQKHSEIRFEAVDIYRKKSVGEYHTWKLEKDISDIYKSLCAVNKRRRSAIDHSSEIYKALQLE